MIPSLFGATAIGWVLTLALFTGIATLSAVAGIVGELLDRRLP